MRVVVTGANGAVGRAIIRAAPSRQVEIVAAIRSERAASEVRSLGGAASVVLVSYGEDASLVSAMADAAAVIHLPGVLFERPGSTYEDANVETTRRMARAAARAAVRKIVLVSAVGADARSSNRYWRTKAEAEAIVRTSGIPFTVLRVPMLLGRGTEAAAALRRRLAHGAIPLLAGGRTVEQPLDVDDLAHGALRAGAVGVAAGQTLDLVGPVALTVREMVERAAATTGRRVRVVPVPARAARLIARMMRGRGPSPDALEVLTTDTRLDPAPAVTTLGVALTALDHTIRESLRP
jgi:NADH dehydrogenase